MQPCVQVAPASETSDVKQVQIPTRLNNTPQSREQRRFFYLDSASSVLHALQGGESRLRMRCTVPETNPEMDVYRVGTLLEMVRELAAEIAEDGKRVKVCVQGSMGEGVFQGLPLTLSGKSPPAYALVCTQLASFLLCAWTANLTMPPGLVTAMSNAEGYRVEGSSCVSLLQG